MSPPADVPDGLVDVHVHLGPSDSGEVYYPDLAAAELADVAAVAGVTASCAFPPYQVGGYAGANAEVLAAGRGSGGTVLPFARLGGRRPAFCRTPRPWQLRRAARRGLLGVPPDLPGAPGAPDGLPAYAGVKLLPHLDGLPDAETFAVLRELRLPVVVHGGEHVPPAWVERRLLPLLGRCPVVLAHLGVFPLAEPLLADALALVRRRPGVVLDTSGVWSSVLVARAVRAAPDQVVFGSDAPLTHPAVAWQHVAESVRDDGLLERVGAVNPARVLAGAL
ncbi:amidohydrolase family protein [Pseudokineococcus sp. 1T1Z-3]|uniref:amidohydrolase family protein n=1 Tax=Pseudokineococcus sp. 1T1Z-3 TaxID=3132745 RepID=UPI0030A123AE